MYNYNNYFATFLAAKRIIEENKWNDFVTKNGIQARRISRTKGINDKMYQWQKVPKAKGTKGERY